MRRSALVPAAGAAFAAVALTAHGGSNPRLPLHSLPAGTSPLAAIAQGPHGFRLERLNPSTLAVVARSSLLRSTTASGWVGSPNGRRLAVETCRPPSRTTECKTYRLRFADVPALRWEHGGIPLPGPIQLPFWPRRGTLYALAGRSARLTLVEVDVAARRIARRTPVAGWIVATARSADGLVLLAGEENAIVPARLIAIGPYGAVRSVGLDRILAGTHYERASSVPPGTTDVPGLAVDPTRGTAYVVSASGVVASVRLDDLAVSYHTLGGGSLLSRLAAWLTPPAQAKGASGPTLTAQWLGHGLLAVGGEDERTTAESDSYTPLGLRIVDTRDWSVRTIDSQATGGTVADGVLLATGGSVRENLETGVIVRHSEGLVAYGPSGSLRWRLWPHTDPFVEAVYRSRALVLKPGSGIRGPSSVVLDLGTGHVIGREASLPTGLPLVGAGSGFGY